MQKLRALLSRGVRALPFALALVCALAGAMSSRADDVPLEAIVADLPFLNVPGSPRIHLDLAAPGDPPLPVMLDTGFNYALGSASAIGKIGGRPLEGRLRGVERDTALGVPLMIQTSEIVGKEAADHQWIRFGGGPLRAFILELDFEKRRVRFIDREKFPLSAIEPSEQSAIVPIRPIGYRPFLMILLNGRETFVAIDTTVTLPLSIGTRELAKAAVHPKTLPILRARGERRSNTRLFETDQVRVGPFEFGIVPVFVSPPGQQDALGMSGAAIGLDLLANFKVRLDLQGKEMWLERTRTTPVGFGGLSYAYTRTSGLFLGPIGHQWLVLGVLPGSPADSSGFMADDRLARESSEFSDARVVHEAVRKQQPLTIERRVDGQTQKLIAPAETARHTR